MLQKTFKATMNVHYASQEHFKTFMHASKSIQNHQKFSQCSTRTLLKCMHGLFKTTTRVHNVPQEHFKTGNHMHASKNVQNHQKHSQRSARRFQDIRYYYNKLKMTISNVNLAYPKVNPDGKFIWEVEDGRRAMLRWAEVVIARRFSFIAAVYN